MNQNKSAFRRLGVTSCVSLELLHPCSRVGREESSGARRTVLGPLEAGQAAVQHHALKYSEVQSKRKEMCHAMAFPWHVDISGIIGDIVNYREPPASARGSAVLNPNKEVGLRPE